MSKDTPSTKPVDKNAVLAFLQGLKLLAIRVRHLKVDANQEFAHAELKRLDHHEDYRYECLPDGRPPRIDAEHKVRLVGPRNKTLGSVAVTFAWYYESKMQMTDEIFEIFVLTVRFQTWPHLRELIRDIAGRASWPHLTLPLFVVSQPPGHQGEAKNRE